MRYLFLLILVSACLGAGAVARADDTFLNYWLPSIFGPPQKGPKPQDTLIAPFAQSAEKDRKLSEGERQAMSSPENAIPIDQPHRSDKYVLSWASERTAGAFIFNPTKIIKTMGLKGDGLYKMMPENAAPIVLAEHFKTLDPYFAPDARKSLESYLETSGMTTSLSKTFINPQQIDAFTKNIPQMMNQGVFSGVYRWLVDVPVTISILPPGMQNYMGKNKKITPTTQNIVIRLQIGRTPASAAYVDGMAIETFTILGAAS